MANKSTVFPAFLRMEYDQGDAKARFKADLQEITRTIEAAAKRPGKGGAINLGLGDLQKAKQDAQQFAQAAQQVLSAAERAAANASSGYTQLTSSIGGTRQAMAEVDAATRSYIAASRASLIEANTRVQSIDAEIRAMQILQTELNKTAAARSTGKPDLNFGVDSLMAGKASIDRAALSMSTLEGVMGRVNREGQKSRQAFDTITGSSREAARAADQLQRDLDELRGSIDPLYYATRKYNEEQERANRLLAQGAISTEEHGRAMQVAGVEYGAAMRNAAGSTSNLRQATVQTGQQLQDIAISLYSGQRAGTVFAQQLPQLAFALSSLEGSANKTHHRIGQFATFLSGPWGVAVGLAVGVLGTYIASLFETEEATKKTEKASYELSESFDFQSASVETLKEATKEWLKVSEKAIQNSYEQAVANRAGAQAKLEDAKAEIKRTRAALEYQQNQLDWALNPANPSAYRVNAFQNVQSLGSGVAGSTARLDALESSIGGLQRTLRNTDISVMQMEVNDPNRVRREKEEAALNAEFQKGKISRDEYKAGLKAINDEFEAANKAERAAGSKKKAGRTKREREETTSFSEDRGESIFNEAKKYMGLNENVSSDNRILRGLFTEANQNIDPKITAWCAAFVNAVLATEGLPGTGKLTASSFKNYGQEVNNPEVGDIVVLKPRPGQDTTGHVGFYAGRTKDGKIKVLGGNQGDDPNKPNYQSATVSINEFDPSRVVSYRRPNGSDAQTRAAERERKLVEQDQRRAEQQLLNSQNIANEIANINSRWDEQPRLIDQSAKSVRDLDLIMAELNSKSNDDLPNRAALLAQAADARLKASQAVNTELDRYLEQGQDELDLLDLQARGLNEQADIQREINQLDERLGIRKSLEGLYEQRDVQQAILADTGATLVERAKAAGILKSTNVQIATAEGLQSKMVDGVTAEFYQRQAVNREIERTNAIMDEQVGLVRDVESGLRGIFTGQNNAGDFFKGAESAFKQYGGNRLFDSIFGDAFDLLEEDLRKDTPMGKATDKVVKNFDYVSEASASLVAAFQDATTKMNGTLIDDVAIASKIGALKGKFSASNDNGDIVVQGGTTISKVSQRVRLEARSTEDMANRIAKGIVDPLLAGWEDIFGSKFMTGLSGVLTGALAGYMRAGNVGAAVGGAKGVANFLGASSGVLGAFDTFLTGAEKGGQYNTVLSGILGRGRTSRTGSQIGGGFGGNIGFALGGPGGAMVGELAGSVIGSLVGGLFKKKKYGTASLSGGGEFSVYGNSASNREAADGLGGSVMDGLNSIADALGADIGSFRTSIGLYKGNYRVSSTGRTGKLKAKYGDVTDFGDDEAAAIKFAIADAVKDGAITGLRAATQRLLQQGDDVDAQLQKALDFEGVFTSLKAIKDPVGAALDTLDKEFERLIKIFGEAGASSEEYAQLEELYGIKRSEAVEEANSRVLASLRGLLDDLTIGDAGLSLRSRLGSAQSAYNPLAARVAAGDTTAYDDYANAARQLLDLQREVYGSTDAYFALLDEVTSLTQTRVDAESNVSSIAAGRASPFDTTQVSTAVTDQTQILSSHLTAINDNLITLIETMAANGNTGAGIINIGNF